MKQSKIFDYVKRQTDFVKREKTDEIKDIIHCVAPNFVNWFLKEEMFFLGGTSYSSISSFRSKGKNQYHLISFYDAFPHPEKFEVEDKSKPSLDKFFEGRNPADEFKFDKGLARYRLYIESDDFFYKEIKKVRLMTNLKYLVMPDIFHENHIDLVFELAKRFKEKIKPETNIIICPKIPLLMKEISSKDYMTGFSIPTTWGGYRFPKHEEEDLANADRIHFLGGSPQKQADYLIRYYDQTLSLDGNIFNKIAHYGQHYTVTGELNYISNEGREIRFQDFVKHSIRNLHVFWKTIFDNFPEIEEYYFMLGKSARKNIIATMLEEERLAIDHDILPLTEIIKNKEE